MQPAIDYLKQIGIPTGSANETGVHVSRYMDSMSIDEYANHIAALTDQRPVLESRKHGHLTLAYLCQFMIKQQEKLGAIDPVICLSQAVDKVNYHYKHNRYFFTEGEVVEGSRNVVDGVNRPQGWKREQAIQFMRDNKNCAREDFIKHCTEELEMSTAGATSYYYMAYEAVFGKKPPAAQRGKKVVEGKVSRRDQAVEVMRAEPTISRADFIKKCVDDLDMTEAGATTYYYAAYEAVHGTKPPKLPRGKGAHKK